MKQICITSFFQKNAIKNTPIIEINPSIQIYPKKVQIPIEYTLYFDGCSKGNPGPAGAGAALYQGKKEMWAKSIFVGNNSTNNVAEYTGLIIGLHEAVNRKIKELIVKGDSMLVIKQMKGEYKVHSKDMLRLYENAKSFENSFDKIVYEHIYREHNTRADLLSNQGLTLHKIDYVNK
jgi:ribonuclease HI